MKTAIVYYSYTGNTNRVANIILEYLKGKGEEVIPVRIRPLNESNNFIVQCIDTLLGKEPELFKTKLDLTEFDRVILGSPIWGFRPTPAINTYLKTCAGLEGKEAISFVTYLCGIGARQTFKNMEDKLKTKGAKIAGNLSFHQKEDDTNCKNKIAQIL